MCWIHINGAMAEAIATFRTLYMFTIEFPVSSNVNYMI